LDGKVSPDGKGTAKTDSARDTGKGEVESDVGPDYAVTAEVDLRGGLTGLAN
jgi:hypothetical protein